MAEIFFDNEGDRVFNVESEGVGVLDNLDLLADIGEKFEAKAYPFESIVTDGSLDIIFSGVVDEAKVSALEIFYDSEEQD